MKSLRWPAALFAGIAVAALAACTDPATSTMRPAAKYQANATSAGPSPVECPASVSLEASAVINGQGGSLSVGGTNMTLPIGAVRGPTKISLRIPASNYMEIGAGANDQEHFSFQAPVTITISYARCTRSNIEKGPLTVWYIDPVTKTLIAPMGGIDDKVNQTITFTTDHLSGYVIAN